MQSDSNYTLYFQSEWLPADQINHDFMDHALHFSNGVSGEVRSYDFNGDAHLFKARKNFNSLIRQANEKGISTPYSVQELVKTCYELLVKNGLTNAVIKPIFYKKDNVSQLVISAKKADVFTIREKVAIHGEQQIIESESIKMDQEGIIGHDTKNPFFFIKNGVLYTPKVDKNEEPSILRDTIIECAIWLGYPLIEKTIEVEELEGSEVAFFSNTTYELNFIQKFRDIEFTKDWRDTMAHDLVMMFRQQATNEDFWNYSII